MCNRYRKKALKSPFILNSLGLDLLQQISLSFTPQCADIRKPSLIPAISTYVAVRYKILRGESQVGADKISEKKKKNKDDDEINFIATRRL